jgi:hypothetical protein
VQGDIIVGENSASAIQKNRRKISTQLDTIFSFNSIKEKALAANYADQREIS